MIENIISVYNQASPGDISAGLRWYESAKRECSNLARRNGIKLGQAIGIVAALSPRVNWGRNVIAAQSFIRGIPGDKGIAIAIDRQFKTKIITRTSEKGREEQRRAIASQFGNIHIPCTPIVALIIGTWSCGKVRHRIRSIPGDVDIASVIDCK